MRVLPIVLGAQIAALVFAGAILIRMDARLAGLEAAADTPHPLSPASVDFADAPTPLLSEADLRAVIREELAAATPLSPTAAPAADPAPARAPTETTRLVVEARRDLDVYLARGKMNEVEMAKFQTKIADLPAAERSAILRAMTKAMNENRLDAQF